MVEPSLRHIRGVGRLKIVFITHKRKFDLGVSMHILLGMLKIPMGIKVEFLVHSIQLELLNQVSRE